MNNCPNCGKELADNARFCMACGKEIVENNAETDCSDILLIQQQNNVLKAVRECAKSKLFLVAIVVCTVAVLISFLSAVVDGVVNINGELSDVAVELGGIVIALAPAVLILIGMWITYSSAKRNDEMIKTSGITLIKIVAIIMLVLSGVELVTSLSGGSIVFFLFKAGGVNIFEPENGGDVFVAMFFIFFIIFLIIAAVGMVFFSFAVKMLSSFKATVETGKLPSKISYVVAVLTIIIGIILAAFSVSDGLSISIPILLPSGISIILLGVLIIYSVRKIKIASRVE